MRSLFAARKALLFGLSLLLIPSLPLGAQTKRASPDERTKRPAAAPRSQRPDHQEMNDNARYLRGLKGEKLERAYLLAMIDHLQSGIDLAKIAEKRGESNGVQRMARGIMVNNRADINQMRIYLIKWYQIPATAKSDPRLHDTLQRLGVLSGDAFDRAFLKEMARHHEMSILMSLPVRSRAPHAALRRFATDLALNQRDEQTDMRRLVSRL